MLRSDKDFILYRGRCEDDESQVLVLSPVTEYPAPEILKWLEHAYSLREQLDPAWAARPMAIARHWDRTILVSEDPGGIPLDQLLGNALDLAFCLRVSTSLANVIGRLHQRGIVHKDIKPANVLVNSVTGQVWLMGFGIASRLAREPQAPEAPEFVAGTLAYMAPEQTDDHVIKHLNLENPGSFVEPPSQAEVRFARARVSGRMIVYQDERVC